MTGRVDRAAAGLVTEAVKQGVRRLIDMAEDKAGMAAFIISRLEEPKKLGLDQERAAVVRAAALEAIGEWAAEFGGYPEFSDRRDEEKIRGDELAGRLVLP